MKNLIKETAAREALRAKILSGAHPQLLETSQPPRSSYKCKTCSDLGYLRADLPVGQPGFGRISACPDCNKVALEAECGLSERERERRLAHVVTEGRPGAEAMLRAARQFLSTKSGILSLHGSWGNGKSLILQALVNECRLQGIEARYLTATELIMWLREAFDEKILDTDRARIERLARVPVLCVDELDKVRDTPFAREMQQHLIDRRYRDSHQLGTVFAWNGSFSALGMPAVSSRLSEFAVVENTDADLRPIVGALKQKREANRGT